MENKQKLENTGIKLSNRIGILSYFDPLALSAKKMDHKECDDHHHDHEEVETKKRAASIEKKDSRRLKYEKKFPKEKQDAIKSLINKDEQQIKEMEEKDEDEEDDHCDHHHEKKVECC